MPSLPMAPSEIYLAAVQSESQSFSHVQALISSIHPSNAPKTRSQSSGSQKRKRSPTPPPNLNFQFTPLTSLFVDGMDEEQVWSQLDLRAKHVCQVLELALLEGDEEGDEEVPLSMDGDEDDLQNEDGMDMDAYDDEDQWMDDYDEEHRFDEHEPQEEDEEESSEDEEVHESIAGLRGEANFDEDDDEPLYLDRAGSHSSTKRRKGGHSELDDAFFDLNEFNAETEEAEANNVSSGRLNDDDEGDSDEESVDLFAPVEDVEAFEEEDIEDQPDLYYKDFFDQPASTRGPKPKISQPRSPKKNKGSVRFHDEVRVKSIKSRGKGAPLASLYDQFEEFGDEDEKHANREPTGSDESDSDEGGGDGNFEDEDEEDKDMEDEDEDEDEEDGQETMGRLKDDLFADTEEHELEDEDLSTHQKRLRALQADIADFENENVGKKEWTLMGEATSRTRPQNSLLEEDLEFERLMKAVPIVTEEAVQSLEERIKARILEGRFDDVVRLRPVDDKAFLPSRLIELNDKKSANSLAQIYENDYVAARDGGKAGEDKDGKLQKQHNEIEVQWEAVSLKLDALCNAHFTPKQPKATITTISNIATTSMESALPTSQSTSTMLAPEEIFAPPTSDQTRARSELTPEEKQSLHRKQKKARRKARDQLETSVDKYAAKSMGGVKKQKKEALQGMVKKGKGVTVVGKGKGKEVKDSRKGKSKVKV